MSWASRRLYLVIPGTVALASILYRNAEKSAQKKLQEQNNPAAILGHVDKHIETTLQAAKENAERNNLPPHYSNWLSHNLYQARHLIAMCLGIGAGVAAHKYVGRAAEFRADRTIVDLMGEVEPFHQMRNSFQKEAEKVLHEVAPYSKTEPSSFWDNIRQYVLSFKETVLDYHPTWKERTQAIEAYHTRAK